MALTGTVSFEIKSAKETNMRKLIAAMAIVAGTLSSTSAFAEQVTVTLEDLNLSSEEGRIVLERRIDRAARQVCGMDEIITGTRITPQDRQRCYLASKASTREQLAVLLDRRAPRGG